MFIRLLCGVCAVVLAAVQPRVIYVSPDGNDNAKGSRSKPLATLEAAFDKASELRAENPSAEMTISLGAGIYPQLHALHLDASHSGISVQGAGMGKTILSGAVELPQFEAGEDGVWHVDLQELLPSGGAIDQLFVNGERAVLARTPNGMDFFKTPAVREQKIAEDETVAKLRPGFAAHSMHMDGEAMDAILRLSRPAPSQLRIAFLHAWDITLRPVLFATGSDSTLVVGGMPMKPYNRLDRCSQFYLENDLSMLDAPGEYFYDQESSMLYYIPREGETPASTRATIPSCTTLLAIEGSEAGHVHDLSFRDLSMQHTRYSFAWTGEDPSQAAARKDATVMVDFADRVSFVDCEIAHTGNYGIWMRTGCNDCELSRCHLHDLGMGAVKVGPTAKPSPENEQALISRHIKVDNCIMSGGGRVLPSGVGVAVFHASDCEITHNEVSDFYYSGMSIGWVWGYSHSPAKRNKVLFNHIHHIGWGVLSDMGGIYTLGLSEGTEVCDNVIHDIYSYGYGGWGLYTDEGSSGIRMERNLVYRCKSSGFHQHYGRQNIICNNVFIDQIKAQMEATRVEDHLSFTFAHNIIYSTRGRMYGIHWDTVRSDVHSNMYWNTEGEVSFNGLSLEQWVGETGKDKGSVIADPAFADPAHDDYRIRDLGAAARIGFVTFDYSQAGVYGDAEWKQKAQMDPARIALYDEVVARYLSE